MYIIYCNWIVLSFVWRKVGFLCGSSTCKFNVRTYTISSVRLKPWIGYKIAVFLIREIFTKLYDIPRQHLRLMYDYNIRCATWYIFHRNFSWVGEHIRSWLWIWRCKCMRICTTQTRIITSYIRLLYVYLRQHLIKSKYVHKQKNSQNS